MSTIWGFDHIENKHDVCRHENCKNKFFKFLKEHALKIIDFEKKKIIPLTDEEFQSYD